MAYDILTDPVLMSGSLRRVLHYYAKMLLVYVASEARLR